MFNKQFSMFNKQYKAQVYFIEHFLLNIDY